MSIDKILRMLASFPFMILEIIDWITRQPIAMKYSKETLRMLR